MSDGLREVKLIEDHEDGKSDRRRFLRNSALGLLGGVTLGPLSGSVFAAETDSGKDVRIRSEHSGLPRALRRDVKAAEEAFGSLGYPIAFGSTEKLTIDFESRRRQMFLYRAESPIRDGGITAHVGGRLKSDGSKSVEGAIIHWDEHRIQRIDIYVYRGRFDFAGRIETGASGEVTVSPGPGFEANDFRGAAEAIRLLNDGLETGDMTDLCIVCSMCRAAARALISIGCGIAGTVLCGALCVPNPLSCVVCGFIAAVLCDLGLSLDRESCILCKQVVGVCRGCC